jgi:hypothetical protein
VWEKIIFWVSATLFGGIALLFVAGMGFLAYSWRLEAARFDLSNPDYLYLAALVKEGPKVPGITYYLPATVSLKHLNGGDWQLICLIGGYSDPEEILSQEAAKRGVWARVIEPVERHPSGLTVVEEHEGAISLVDGTGRGKTILIPTGVMLAAESQGFFECFGPETDEITLPIQNAG